jgi:hypothetical protein
MTTLPVLTAGMAGQLASEMPVGSGPGALASSDSEIMSRHSIGQSVSTSWAGPAGETMTRLRCFRLQRAGPASISLVLGGRRTRCAQGPGGRGGVPLSESHSVVNVEITAGAACCCGNQKEKARVQ